MIAIISGKILNAWKVNPNVWLFKLKQYLSSFGLPPLHWEIFGGNALLLKVAAQDALWTAICIKAIFRQVPDLDVALSIGLGTEEQTGSSLRNGAGTAYDYSNWKAEERIPKQATFALQSANTSFDRQFNLLLDFALVSMNEWSVLEAEIVELSIIFPEKSQQEIADWLRIRQSAVSQRRKRAHFDLLVQLNQYYKNELTTITEVYGSL
ncbi:RNA polymerase sigma factor sigma-70 region 4 domain-containing protein [Edaphocola flava]|uniref:hypothetical protein n=1 Tax=Edaphocola flava TaxID=2499629 RepID=UPI00100AC1F7|nr:hypothetical protein [Edaphocola flava]